MTGVFAVLLLGFVVYCVTPPPVSPRAELANDLAKLPGNHLVLVRYGPTHEAENEWVYNGADFDKIYKADQVMAHAETVALLSDYDQNGQNSNLKSWAKQALPVVKGHRAAIDSL